MLDDKLEIKTLEEASNIVIYDENGKEIVFGDLFKNNKCIVIFIRHFLCTVCRDYCTDISKIPKYNIKEANSKLVIIGCAPWKFIKNFKEDFNLEYEIYSDTDLNLYKKLGLMNNFIVNGGSMAHVKTNVIVGVLNSIYDFIKNGFEKQGDISQLGGEFIFGPGNNIILVHRCKSIFDHIHINKLLNKIDAKEIDFDNN